MIGLNNYILVGLLGLMMGEQIGFSLRRMRIKNQID
jgi:xanthosine utilization system XapX-like protein